MKSKIISWTFILVSIITFCCSVLAFFVIINQNGLKNFIDQYQSDELSSAIINIVLFFGIILPLIMFSAGFVRLQEMRTRIFEKIMIFIATIILLMFVFNLVLALIFNGKMPT